MMTFQFRPPEPDHFRKCFDERVRENTNFLVYQGIIDSSSPTPSQRTPEKHHIVPREWLVQNVPGFDFDHEDPRNVVYLSVRNKILAMQYLALVFLDAGNAETYRRITKTIARRYMLGWYEFWRNPYMDPQLVKFLTEKRTKELASRKQKYDDSYLISCRTVMDEGNWTDEAFDEVKTRLGFKYSRRALEEQLQKRFGPKT